MHISRLAEELIIWNSDVFKIIKFDDKMLTGSSIMPQKKNPDLAELVRGRAGKNFGQLQAMLTTMKGAATFILQRHARRQKISL